MIIPRLKLFSIAGMDSKMLSKLVRKLDSAKVSDYGFTSSIPREEVSINTDLNAVEIYLPKSLEYSQYAIDDHVRSMIPYGRTSVVLDRNIYVVKVRRPLDLSQYVSLVRFLTEEEGFCNIISSEPLN